MLLIFTSSKKANWNPMRNMVVYRINEECPDTSITTLHNKKISMENSAKMIIWWG